MKYTHYITAIAFTLILAACGKDAPDGPNEPGSTEAERKALLASNNFCVQQQGKTTFEFDEKIQQIQIDPTDLIFKIISDNGGSYIEFRLSTMPTSTTSATGLLVTTGNSQTSLTMRKVVLLQEKNEMLYLWDDETHTGIILPWVKL